MTTCLTLKQRARYLQADTETPISLYLKQGSGLLLESAEVDGRWGRYSLLADDYLLLMHCRGGKLVLTVKESRFDCLKQFEGMDYLEGLRALLAFIQVTPPENMPNLPPITRGVYGYLGYGIAGLCLPRLAKTLLPEEAEACLVIPGRILLFDHLYNRLVEITYHDDFPTPNDESCVHPPAAFKCNMAEMIQHPDREQYVKQVHDLQEQLVAGEGIQAVLSLHRQAPFSGSSFTLYRSLRQRNPSPYMFYFDFDDIHLLGSSPELNIRCAANQLYLSPIAGTRKRGKTEEEDSALATELLEDPKERAEHVMLVDLGRNDLGRIARSNTLKVERLMEVQRFSHVMHLTSRLSAILTPECDAVDVIKATFPAGTVSGAPKVRAIEMVAECEQRPRGPYAGCIGWIGLDKDAVNMDLGITIRSLWVRDGLIHWQAGAGITCDSVPEKEYDECQNKAAIIASILQQGEENVSVYR